MDPDNITDAEREVKEASTAQVTIAVTVNGKTVTRSATVSTNDADIYELADRTCLGVSKSMSDLLFNPSRFRAEAQ